MKGNGKTENENNKNEKENIWTEIFIHADGHDQSGVNDIEARSIERSGGIEYKSNKD
jgi:hypothetical protein